MTRIPILLLAASVLAASLTACGSPAASSSSAPPSSAPSSAAQGYTFTDDLGRTVTVEQPKRVAALIGSFADVWCLAGGQDALVAAAHDAWTSFDLGLSDTVADLGAVKEPNLEVLLAAQPDFILASCNTTADLELESTFESAGIPTAYFDIQSFDDYLNMLKICTDLTGCPENYETYGLQVQEQVEAAKARQDGSAPTAESPEYTGPIYIDKTTVIRAVNFEEGALPSRAMSRFTGTFLFSIPRSTEVKTSFRGFTPLAIRAPFSSCITWEGWRPKLQA